MSAPAVHDFDSDAEYARQLQDEEFSVHGLSSQSHKRDGGSIGGGGGGSSSTSSNGDATRALRASSEARRSDPLGGGSASSRPFLERAMSVPGQQPRHREVHRHAADQAAQIQQNSPALLVFYVLFGITELAIAIAMLAEGWDQYCDKPLRTWIIVYSGRWVLLIPLAIGRFQRRHIVFTEENPDELAKWQTWYGDARARRHQEASDESQFHRPHTLLLCSFGGWFMSLLSVRIRFFTFIWMIIGQTWYFSASGSNCADTSPWLSKFTLALIIVFYIGLFLPVLMLLLLCMCLPCALILMQFLSTDRTAGAAPDVINSLPKRTYQPPAISEGVPRADEDDAPSW